MSSTQQVPGNLRTIPDAQPDVDGEFIELVEEGEFIHGILVGTVENCGQYNNTVYRFESVADGSLELTWKKHDFAEKLDRAGVEVGDEVFIQATGEVREYVVTDDAGDPRLDDDGEPVKNTVPLFTVATE